MTTRMEEAIDATTREAIRDLILVLADSKRLLGYRYAEWMLGAPELETGIACSSMAQDEWGHARLLYALLKEFGDDVDALEHGREPSEYRNMEILDESPAEWADTVALMALADPALSIQLEALRGSRYEPLSQRVEKLLDEERFHAAHGAAWFRRLANGTAASRDALAAAVDRAMPSVLAWFGPDSERSRRLQEVHVSDATGPMLRSRFLERVGPLLELVGRADAYDQDGVDLEGFDEARRRAGGRGPDDATIRKVRGDHNRAFLMD